MKPPTPWKRSGASAPAAARLLDAARPPPPFDDAARQRAAARLGAATGVTGFGAMAAASASAPRPASALGAGGKITVAAIAAGVIALSFALWPARPAPGPASAAAAAVVVEAPPAPPVATAVETAAVPVRSVDDLPSAPPPVVAASAPKRIERADDGLERELQLVDGARAAIAGRPAEALRLLDQHARAYPAGQLALERDLLRVEALVSLGRHDEAALFARSLADRAPRSLQAQRAAKLVGDAP